MQFRRFQPRHGSQEAFDLSIFQTHELVYIDDRCSLARIGSENVDYGYNYNDFIIENVPKSGALLISDDKYADKYEVFKVHALGSFEHAVVNNIYTGYQTHVYGPDNDVIDIQSFYDTHGEHSGFHWTGINKITFSNCNYIANTILGSNFDITGANSFNGWRKLFVNQNSGDILRVYLNDKHSLESLVGIYGYNNELYTTSLKVLPQSPFYYTALENFEHIPKICFPTNLVNPSAPYVQIIGGNESETKVNTKLKKIALRDFCEPYYSSNASTLSLYRLSGLKEIDFDNCFFGITTIYKTSVSNIDFTSFSGHWKRLNIFTIQANSYLTGFNIPYSGVGYLPTGDSDYSASATKIGGEFDLRDNGLTASGLNHFYLQLVDLTTITGVDSSGINVSGNIGTGQAGYNASLATSKGWYIY